MSQAEQGRIWAVRARGLNDIQVARRLGLERRRVTRYLAGCGGIRPPARTRSAQCLTRVEREEISRGIARGDSARQIAVGLGRSHTTVSREIKRSGGRRWYRAVFADEEAWTRARRPKQAKLDLCPELLDQVAAQLNGRPRKTLGFMTPAEKLRELIDGAPTPAPDR